MIKDIQYIIADGTVPFRNQAVEELLMQTVKPGTCILYLWQNRQTVVIGRNQNGRAECRVDQLEKDGGYLARRLSGGGAVFHDLGNLNFSFLACDPDYSVERQQHVILSAVRSFGLNAEVTGRNDIAIDGRKFSGNAFMSTGIRHCHHGTLLLGADTSAMEKYLSVSSDKLESKGVRSVRSRVVNLSDLAAGITPDSMTAALVYAFSNDYGLTPRHVMVSELDPVRLNVLAQKFSSREWRLGHDTDFMYRQKSRFAWGGAELCLRVSGEAVAEARLYTDSLDPEFSGIVENALIGTKFSGSAMQYALGVANCTPDRRQMLRDISSLLQEASR
jgi:lipoate---protein ligase